MYELVSTAGDAFDRYKAALDEGRLIQNNWHSRDSAGRELACGLGILGQSVNGPRDCPAEVMPGWLAQYVPYFFDGQNIDDAKAWGLDFYAELKRLGGNVPFSVVYDFEGNVVCQMMIDVFEKTASKSKPSAWWSA